MASLVFTHEREERKAISDFPKWPNLIGWRLEYFSPCVSLQVFEGSSHTFSCSLFPRLLLSPDPSIIPVLTGNWSLKGPLLFRDINFHMILEVPQDSFQVSKLEIFRVWKLLTRIVSRSLPILVTSISHPSSVCCWIQTRELQDRRMVCQHHLQTEEMVWVRYFDHLLDTSCLFSPWVDSESFSHCVFYYHCHPLVPPASPCSAVIHSFLLL